MSEKTLGHVVTLSLGQVVTLIVHGPEAKFSDIGTTQRDKGSYVICDVSVYVDNGMR